MELLLLLEIEMWWIDWPRAAGARAVLPVYIRSIASYHVMFTTRGEGVTAVVLVLSRHTFFSFLRVRLQANAPCSTTVQSPVQQSMRGWLVMGPKFLGPSHPHHIPSHPVVEYICSTFFLLLISSTWYPLYLPAKAETL